MARVSPTCWSQIRARISVKLLFCNIFTNRDVSSRLRIRLVYQHFLVRISKRARRTSYQRRSPTIWRERSFRAYQRVINVRRCNSTFVFRVRVFRCRTIRPFSICVPSPCKRAWALKWFSHYHHYRFLLRVKGTRWSNQDYVRCPRRDRRNSGCMFGSFSVFAVVWTRGCGGVPVSFIGLRGGWGRSVDIAVLKVRSSYSSASSSMVHSNIVLSGMVTDRTIRRTCNNIIPRLTSHTRRRGVVPIITRTVGHTNVSGSRLDTITFAHKPNLVKSLLIKASFTGNLTTSLSVPVVRVGRLRTRILTRFVGRAPRSSRTPSFPFLYLLMSNKGSRVVGIGTCGSVRIVKRAVSSTTNRTFSGYTGIVKLKCPKKPIIGHLTGRKGPGTFAFDGPRVLNCSCDFDKLGASFLCALHSGLRRRPSFVRGGGRSLYTSLRTAIVSVLVGGLHQTTGSLNVGRITMTNNMSTGSNLQSTFLSRTGHFN